ncbi:hypothetical protein KR032_003892 [Drosophila birchii]|nr:hypothetical protein KR032_003892 [Drosophila birchii]
MNLVERHLNFNDTFDGMWKKERKFLDQIFDQGISLEPKQLMQFHDYVYHHCSSFVHNDTLWAQDPGKHLHECLTEYLTSRLREMAAELEAITDYEQLLIVYAGKWQPYQKACAELDPMCRYFNVNWVKRELQMGHNNILEVYPMAMHLWMEIVFRPIDRSLVDSIINQRKYAASLVYQVLQSIVQLYANDVRQETSVRDKLINIFGMESGVIQFYEEKTTEKFEGILATKKYSALKPFLKYACLAMPEIEEKDKFKGFLKSHIAPQLTDAIARSKGGKDYVQAILALRHGPLERGLREHKKLLYVIDQVCETAINSSEINHKMTSTELLVRYTHQLMTTKHPSEEDELKRIVEVVEFIYDKDKFLMRYKASLQNRQINETSTSDDLEVTMVSLLRKRFGQDATRNLTMQMKEMEKSNIIKDQFGTYLIEKNIRLGFDFRLKCFKDKDDTPKMNLILPVELQVTYDVFKDFYHKTYKDMKLNFDVLKSSGELIININRSSPYFVKMSLLQMALLLQFNQNDNYTVMELAGMLGTDIDTITPVLDCCIREKILVCGESLSASSSVEVAKEFTNRKRHLNINMVPTKQRKVEADFHDRELIKKRSIQVQCAVVRIMKKSMIISHTQLIGEVIEALKNNFKPDIKLIKREIEYLISKSFIERSQNNSYTYIS